MWLDFDEPNRTITSLQILKIKGFWNATCFTWLIKWCPQQDLNPRPPDYKSGALPAEL